MNYSSIPLMTTFTMAKSTMKTTTYSTTNIMLLLSLNPVIITKQGRKRSNTRPFRTRIVHPETDQSY